jgi:hypothetical protein
MPSSIFLGTGKSGRPAPSCRASVSSSSYRGFVPTHVYLSQPFPGYRQFIIKRIAGCGTAAAAAARNTAAVDEIARLTWRAHSECQLTDVEAEAVSVSLQARRAIFATRPHRVPLKVSSWPSQGLQEPALAGSPSLARAPPPPVHERHRPSQDRGTLHDGRAGRLDGPGEAASLSTLVGNVAKAGETVEIVARIAKLEEQLSVKGNNP